MVDPCEEERQEILFWLKDPRKEKIRPLKATVVMSLEGRVQNPKLPDFTLSVAFIDKIA